MKIILIFCLAFFTLLSCGSENNQAATSEEEAVVADTLSSSLQESEERLDELSQELNDLLLQLD